VSVASEQEGVVRFAEFELDLRSGELRTKGTSVRLQPQPAKILTLLVRRRGETVTRHEIIQEVWGSDTFVDYEQGLNFAIRQIRNSLRDDAERPLYIETVPKRGYRFVGQVVADAPRVSGTTPNRSILWIFALFSAVVVGSIFAALSMGVIRERLKPNRRAHQSPSTAPVGIRRSVAVLGFKNLSQREEAAWVSTALTEMLTTELGAGEKLRVITGENVARVKNDLSLVDTNALERDALMRLHQNLRADLVASGEYSYMNADSGLVRIDIRVQDVVTGKMVASDTEVGNNASLFQMISRSGADLREKLGASGVSELDLASVQASYPSNPEAARLYAQGLARLRLFDAIQARDLLEKAVVSDPRYAQAHAGLGLAWSALGYEGRAEYEAQTAFQLSGNLSREDRLRVEGMYREIKQEWGVAQQIYQTLFDFFPDNLEYGLRLAQVETNSGRFHEAMTTLNALRKLPPPDCDDPRIDLIESGADEYLGDVKRMLAAAEEAASKGAARGSRLEQAEALMLEGNALRTFGQTEKSMLANEEAARMYAAAGDRNGVGRALNHEANLLASTGDIYGATRRWKESLAISRDIGNKKGEAAVLNNLANVQGDLPTKKHLWEQMLLVEQETGNRQGMGSTLASLARLAFGEGNLGEARKKYAESLALASEVGNKTDIAADQIELAATLTAAGDLVAARHLDEEALQVFRQAGDKGGVAATLSTLAETARAQGDIEMAKRMHEEAMAIRSESGRKNYVAQSRLSLADLAVDDGRLVDAVTLVRDAREEFRKEKQPDLETAAETVLVRVLLAQNEPRQAQEEVKMARKIAEESTTFSVRLDFAIEAARVETTLGKPFEAKAHLEAVLADATKHGYVGLLFETRLALGEFELKSGKSATGLADLRVLEEDATHKGFLLIARRAAKERG
jgi:DNA-binding winged helix-turn-helix (wHTH) protein/tetratricopeptide (TPR) repeat protein